jgi:hypothetical protein
VTTHKAHPKAPETDPDAPRVARLATRAGVEPVYPRWAHQAGGTELVVYSEAEALALGDDWNWVPPPPPPVLTALEPATVAIGDPSFTLHVHGTGFLDDAVIVFADHDEPTTVVSPTEVTTGVDMSLWLGPDTVPVTARNADGVVSNALDFVFTEAPASRSRPGHGHGKHAAHEGD